MDALTTFGDFAASFSNCKWVRGFLSIPIKAGESVMKVRPKRLILE